MKVVKFGGTSLASSEAIMKAREIILADPSRTFVVVSAPGKCKGFDRKVTDLLIDAATELCFSEKSESLDKVLNRFESLSTEVGVNIKTEIERVREEVTLNKRNPDFIISRGEYLMAILFAKLLNFKFIDAANYVVVKSNGRFNEVATRAKFMRCINKNDKIVMGGFYGQSERNGILTVFSRGGSDYSGAIAAVCLKADMYENWTDTCGVQTANPAIVKHTRTLQQLDFTTMHKLSSAGASVIYPDCLLPLRRHNIPLKIDSTFNPGQNWTLITREKVNTRFFCITYNIRQNINKDTAEILVVLNRVEVHLSYLKELLKDFEVYLVDFSQRGWTLISPVENVNAIVNLLHDYLSKSR